MKLDRNIDGGHGNKYGLIKNRRIEELRKLNGCLPANLADALLTLADCGVLDWGCTPETEFFVIRLKDENADGALHGYAASACKTDLEYAQDIQKMALRSGVNHPDCKRPD